MAKTSKAAQSKKEVVKKCVEMLNQYPIVGVLNMSDLPAAQLQKMKKQLRGKVEMFMARKTLMSLAIEKAKSKSRALKK